MMKIYFKKQIVLLLVLAFISPLIADNNADIETNNTNVEVINDNKTNNETNSEIDVEIENETDSKNETKNKNKKIIEQDSSKNYLDCLFAPVGCFLMAFLATSPGFYYRTNHDTGENSLVETCGAMISLFRTGYFDFTEKDDAKNMHILSTFLELQANEVNNYFNDESNIDFLWGINYSYSHKKIFPIMFTAETAAVMTEEYDKGVMIGGGLTLNMFGGFNLSAMARETYINNERITDLGIRIYINIFVEKGILQKGFVR